MMISHFFSFFFSPFSFCLLCPKTLRHTKCLTGAPLLYGLSWDHNGTTIREQKAKGSSEQESETEEDISGPS